MSRFGVPAALFAIKCYLSAMLALYLSFSIGLSRPYWAITTSFIIAQPLAGAVLSKAVYRVIGTILGAAATILLVPNLANAPELLSVAIALWLGLCVFIALLDRTPRSYIFVLGGYSACIIGLPSVGMPDAIFNEAITRVQEITIGIMCGSLVHGILFPGSVTDMLLRRVDATLRDAERWSRDSISGRDRPGLDGERRRLALDITEMHQLSTHLPFETARAAPRVRTVRALQDQLSQILPLTVAVEDRMKALAEREGGLSPAITALIRDCCDWLAAPDEDPVTRRRQVQWLCDRAAMLEPETARGMGWEAALRLNLLARLASLMEAHGNCRDLRDQMTTPTSKPVTPRVAELLAAPSDRALHRDYGGALRTAFAAALTVIIGCALWIGSGWKDGSLAVMLAGVFLALFSAADDPIAPLRTFLMGTAFAIMIGGLYGFVILPRVDGFPMLAAALAPPLLLGGALMASPRYAMVALAAMLGLANPTLLAATYKSSFTVFVNENIATIMGVLLALVMTRLLQSAGLERAIRRTLKAGWNDIAASAEQRGQPNVSAWISRMLDRIGMLVPRLAARGDDPGQPLYDALRDLRTGIIIGELRQLRFDLPRREGAPIASLLRALSKYYTHMDPDQPPPVPDRSMLPRIDRAIGRLITNPSTSLRRSGVLALVSLRRTLFPEATPYHAPDQKART